MNEAIRDRRRLPVHPDLKTKTALREDKLCYHANPACFEFVHVMNV